MKNIEDLHCQQCGETSYEYINFENEGYSGCCNQRVVYTQELGYDKTTCATYGDCSHD